MTSRALVLGSGGIAAYAWEVGLILGISEGGLDLRASDLLVGTSAGSRVAAQAQPPPAQPPGPRRGQLGADRESWSLVSRTVASRASRCAAVTQTRTPTRLPGGTSVWHVTFGSGFDAFDSAGDVVAVEPAAVVDTLAAAASTVVAALAAPAAALGAFTDDARLGETDAQAHSRALVSRVVRTIHLEACKYGIRLPGEWRRAEPAALSRRES